MNFSACGAIGVAGGVAADSTGTMAAGAIIVYVARAAIFGGNAQLTLTIACIAFIFCAAAVTYIVNIYLLTFSMFSVQTWRC